MTGSRGAQGTGAHAATRVAAVFLAAALLLSAPAARADFAAGWAAYQAGDFGPALAQWRALAEQGDPRSQFNLGVMYDEGKGVDRDLAMARGWWRKAA